MQTVRHGWQTHGGSRVGFTLVELLVVIAVIAILASLLLPVLVRAKETGRAAVCKNNLRQLGLASVTYSLDNKGRFPYFPTTDMSGPGGFSFNFNLPDP